VPNDVGARFSQFLAAGGAAKVLAFPARFLEENRHSREPPRCRRRSTVAATPRYRSAMRRITCTIGRLLSGIA
jgi:hypothetical protein